MAQEFSRRDIFAIAGATGVVATVPNAAAAQSAPAPTVSAPPQAVPLPQQLQSNEPLLFFNEEEAAFIKAVIDLLIPADDSWPGAVGCGVLTYLDRQLAGAYGAGARLYLQGPWKQGTPEQGYQLPYTPAELYRTAMDKMFRYLKRGYGGRQFGQLNLSERDKLLRAMESGELDLGPVPSTVFFETLLANTIEGFFADPAYGGNRDMAAWRMIGFPGAYAQYAPLIEHHGIPFDQAPISMAQAGHAHGAEGHHTSGGHTHAHGEPATRTSPGGR